jgi:hypothetical protein
MTKFRFKACIIDQHINPTMFLDDFAYGVRYLATLACVCSLPSAIHANYLSRSLKCILSKADNHNLGIVFSKGLCENQ